MSANRSGNDPSRSFPLVARHDLPSPRWPVYAVPDTADQLVRSSELRTFGSTLAAIVGVSLMVAVIVESAWIVAASAVIGTAMLLALRQTRLIRGRVHEHAVSSLRARCDERRSELVARMSGTDRAGLDRLEWMVEHVRGVATDQAQPLDAMLVERLDRMLYHYVRLAVDRQRTSRAYELVSESMPSHLARGESESATPSPAQLRIVAQRSELTRMRAEARTACQEQLQSARMLLDAISELVTLVYEQSLCRTLVVEDVVARIDDALEEFAHFGEARAEAEAAADDEPSQLYALCGGEP
ncbi:MAG TPA: hypothetical protein VML75_05355 [Kofleriaceae bacterium]|nr:hypothetical protein [Kofleriaceae bacterium]